MGVLGKRETERARERLAGLADPVTLIHFTQDLECAYTRRARRLLEEIAGLSDRIHLRIVDFAADRETAGRYGVDHVPATVIAGPRGFGVRFDGLPEGAELTTFFDGIAIVSDGDAEPDPGLRDRLAVLASSPTREVVTTKE